MTPRELHSLGWLLRRGGPRWHRYVLLARELRDGTGWDMECAEKVYRALGLGREPIPFGSSCPACPVAQPGRGGGTRTALSLPDRFVAECTACGAEWVRLTERSHLEPFRTREECQSAAVG